MNRIQEKSEKYSVIMILLAGVIHCIIRFIVASYSKRIFTYPDELRYLSIAKSIFYYGEVSIYNLPTSFQKILYPLSISLAMFFETTEIQIKAITLINCVWVSAGIIPVYFLANKYLTKTHVLCCVVLYLVFSDLIYADVFMSECLYIPLGILVIYCVSNCLDHIECNKSFSAKEKCYFFFCGVLLYLLYLCKEIALAFLISFYFVIITFSFKKIRRKEKTVKSLFDTFYFFLGFLLPFIIMKLTLFSGLGNSYNQQDFGVFADGFNIFYVYYAFVYFVLFGMLGYTVFPFLIPAFNFKALDSSTKKLYLYLITCFLILAATISFTISVRENWGTTTPRLHLRYISCLYLPFLIVLFRTIEIGVNRKKEIVVASAVFLLWIFYYFIVEGRIIFHDTEIIDQTQLMYFLRWDNFQFIIMLIYSFITLMCMFLIDKKIGITMMVVSIFALNCYNTVLGTTNFKNGNVLTERERSEMYYIEQLIEKHPSSNFLVLLNDRADLPIIDTCVHSKNVLWIDIGSYQNAIENSNEHDWKSMSLMLHNGYTDKTYDFVSIDYIIWNSTLKMKDLDGNIIYHPYVSISEEYGQLIKKPMEEPKIIKLDNPYQAPRITSYFAKIDLP